MMSPLYRWLHRPLRSRRGGRKVIGSFCFPAGGRCVGLIFPLKNQTNKINLCVFCASAVKNSDTLLRQITHGDAIF